MAEFRFDPADARRLKPGEWLKFPGHAGLRLKRASRHVFTWAYRFKSPLDDRMRQLKLGNWPQTSWAKAVGRWEELRNVRSDGIDPQIERRRKRTEVRAEHAAKQALKNRDATTVEAICELFLKEHVARVCKTEKAKYDAGQMFRSKVYPTLGDKAAHAIDRGDASDFLSTIAIDAPALARLLRSRLGGAWDHAIARKKLPGNSVNPWRGTLAGKLRSKPRSRYLDDGELAVFMDKVRGLDVDTRDALLVTLYTAARSGEVARMSWKDVDVERATWRLHETKTDAPRVVRLPRQAVAILNTRGRGFGMPQALLSGALREAKSLGLKAFTPHDLRRSARTGLARLGVRDEVAEAALGHVEGGVKGVYNLHKHEAAVGEALQRWADHVDALAAPEVASIAQGRRRAQG
jgi:integrase